jgi:hypothetical protein
MSKATKIDANHWEYRGFIIRADYRSKCHPGHVCKTRQGVLINGGTWWKPTIRAAIEQIDEWCERKSRHEREQAASMAAWAASPVGAY